MCFLNEKNLIAGRLYTITGKDTFTREPVTFVGKFIKKTMDDFDEPWFVFENIQTKAHMLFEATKYSLQ